MSSAFLLGLILGVATAHEYFPEKCPEFTPMQGFDWDQFANGVWYVTQKFATRSTCLTYEFTTDELGFKEITQLRQLPYSEKVGLDHEYKYTGKLYAANEAVPAKMNVRFPLNPIGAANFVVLDTDYTSYGLICTCQEIDLFITTGHRRSCSMLQRAVEEDEAITSKLTELLDSQVPDSSHDFDPIKQEGCEHGREKAWTIDPEKVIGGGVGSSVCFGIITSIIVIIVIITIIINIIILTISSIVQMMIIVVILVINMVILFLVFGLSCCLR